MKNSFWDFVGIPFEIAPIEAKSLSNAAEIAHKSSEYFFYGSCWFIDVKSRFRVFSFNNKSYISKEARIKKADVEIANSLEVRNRINGKLIGSRKIEIVVPTKINCASNDDSCFLVSEYLGTDLNENVYNKTTPLLTIKDCFSIVKLLLVNGISYRGFLPRNIVEREDIIYLFDWEDASFSDSSEMGKFDHLWRTNFLLNWSYLFNFSDLERGLKSVSDTQTPLIEPQLVKYENTFNEILSNLSSDAELRNNIDRIVFGSELPLVKPYENFYLRPNDMGHLVADIFPSEIDVLHDILSYSVRMRDERLFAFNIETMTRLIISYYKSTLVQKNSTTFQLKYYALIPIIIMIDDGVSNDDYQDILSVNSLSEQIAKISHVCRKNSAIQLFLSNEQDGLSKLLDKELRKIIAGAYKKVKAENLNIDKIISFILNESSRLNNQS